MVSLVSFITTACSLAYEIVVADDASDNRTSPDTLERRVDFRHDFIKFDAIATASALVRHARQLSTVHHELEHKK